MTTGTAVMGALIITIILWLGLEAWAYLTKRPLITTKVREWTRATGGLPAFVFGLVVGLLAGHFWWVG